MQHQAYFFDFDHTLFDSDASEALAFQFAMREHGIETSDALFESYKQINAELWGEVESAGRPPGEVKTLRFHRLAEQAAMGADPESLADAFTAGMQESGELYPGALELLVTLQDRAPVVMVTNAISEIQRRRIERLDIDKLFEAIVISSEVGVSKPKPQIFDHAFAALGSAGQTLDRSATLMVGDSLTSDMAGGLAAGLATCWFNPQGKAASPTLAIDHEIHRLDQLLDL